MPESFLTFFLIILIGLMSSTLLRRLHFPWVVALVVGGIIMGPNGAHVIAPDETTQFLAQLGLAFMMFMAGLETKLQSFQQSSKNLFILAGINGIIPFVTGIVIGLNFGFDMTTMLIIGTVFVSSSVAVVIPSLEANDLFDLKIGQTVIPTTIIQDVASLLMLSIIFQNINPITRLPLILFYPMLIVTVVAFRYLLPKLANTLKYLTSSDELYQDDLRSIFLVLVGTIIVFELLGLHPIIGAFFAGLVLSDSITDEIVIAKIHAISYGIFVPTFFVLVGMQTDLTFLQSRQAFVLMLAIVLGSIVSKLVSGTLGALMVGFNKPQSLFFGVSSVPQLSTTLAVSYTATQFGLISIELNTAFVALSIVSTIVGPLLMSNFNKKVLTTGVKERVGIRSIL